MPRALENPSAALVLLCNIEFTARARIKHSAAVVPLCTCRRMEQYRHALEVYHVQLPIERLRLKLMREAGGCRLGGGGGPGLQEREVGGSCLGWAGR